MNQTRASETAATVTTPTYPPVEIVMPAHNEAASIGRTLAEFYDVAHRRCGIRVRFVVAEDGSTDDTTDVVRRSAEEIPIRLLTSPERKGYSRAVVDALRQTSGDVCGFIDSDGQCDPRDLPALLDALEGFDLVVGYRHPRRDSAFRIVISRAFGVLYRQLFPVRLRDPSCPYLVIRREALGRVLVGSPGVLTQGFWWEFNARAAAAGLRVNQARVRHRARTAGQTQVYRLGKIPRIAFDHSRGLFALRRELDELRRRAVVRQAHPA